MHRKMRGECGWCKMQVELERVHARWAFERNRVARTQAVCSVLSAVSGAVVASSSFGMTVNTSWLPSITSPTVYRSQLHHLSLKLCISDHAHLVLTHSRIPGDVNGSYPSGGRIPEPALLASDDFVQSNRFDTPGYPSTYSHEVSTDFTALPCTYSRSIPC